MYKVLIVDDEKYICTLVANLVDWQSMNLEVIGMAHSAEEALRIAKETPPDIVISDVSMPDITGLELLKQLKDIHSRISAVFISGYSDFTFVQQALKLDAVDYLLKPIKKADLCNALKKVIAEKDTETIHNNQFEELANQAGSFRDHMQNQFVYEALYDNAALLSLTMAEISKKYFLDSEESDFLIVMVKPDFDIVSDDSYYDFVFSKIRSLFNSLLSSRHIFCYSAPSQSILHLLIQTNQVDFVESVCRKLLYEAQGFLYGQNGHLTIGFNDAPVEVKKLAAGATYCRAALEERLLHGADHLYIVSALQKKQPFNDNILAHTLTALKDNVYRSFDTNQLISKTQARELILNERPQLDRSLSGIEAAQLCNDIFGLLITCMRAHAVTSISELERENYLRKLHAQYTIEGRLEYLYSLYQDLFLEYGKLLYQKEKKPIRDAKLFIENHYPEQITLENVAEAVGFNTSYFSSLFKKETGLNFSDFLNQTRILHAKELLRDRANSAAAVADMVGFRDEKYFSKVFKKTVGLTIKDFRNLYY